MSTQVINAATRTMGLVAGHDAAHAPNIAGATRLVLSIADHLQGGAILWQLPGGARHRSGASGAREIVINVNDALAFERIVARGDIGFADAYLAGELDCDDLAGALTLFADNRAAVGKLLHGQWWRLLTYRLRHLLRANTRGGSRRNIIAHYDLGNDFYRQWLDGSMTYSSALFDSPGMSLVQGQARKYRRILETLKVSPGDEILEVGCGWGGFAEIAAREFGACVHGITLSPAQLDYAQARIEAAGLAGQVTLELRDYRDLPALGRQFKHIVSIEMFEAVGEARWRSYFKVLSQMLVPDGKALVQSIVIAPELFSSYRRGTDFIQQYIFPGGMLPSLPVFAEQAQAQGLAIENQLEFGQDYATTLAHWRASFESTWPRVSALGFDTRFRRLWRFYLAYCEAGFRAGSTSVAQFTLRRAP